MWLICVLSIYFYFLHCWISSLILHFSISSLLTLLSSLTSLGFILCFEGSWGLTWASWFWCCWILGILSPWKSTLDCDGSYSRDLDFTDKWLHKMTSLSCDLLRILQKWSRKLLLLSTHLIKSPDHHSNLKHHSQPSSTPPPHPNIHVNFQASHLHHSQDDQPQRPLDRYLWSRSSHEEKMSITIHWIYWRHIKLRNARYHEPLTPSLWLWGSARCLSKSPHV